MNPAASGPNHELFPPRSRRTALLASVVSHVVLLGSAVIFWASAGAGTNPVSEVRSVGMAVVHRLPDRTRYVTESQVAQEAQAVSAASVSAANDSAAETTKPNKAASAAKPKGADSAVKPPFDLDSVIAALDAGSSVSLQDSRTETGTGQSDAQATAEDLVMGRIRLGDGRSIDELGDGELIPGRARAGLGAGQTTTQVFGVAGTGATFVYVFDRSESMTAAGGAPLRALKSELIRSLDTLSEKQQFQIIFYNDEADVFKPMGDRIGLVTGEKGTIARAKQFVRNTTAIGGTEHEPALKMALRLAPEVIFFLTDAKIQTMSDAQLDEISRRAESAGTTIHGIQFGTGPSPNGSFVEQLAKRNRGGYRYVDVTSLESE
ncbi:VWA domain-containing protein [Neorhodopirellula pilleata]|uniref:VWFA domain-containing protein n=1 Tax=Neorhodopirellula pilleata TaxID=2714738 RepID=A0A5C6AAS8_9BACT|nr:VWA domain-containing protein [Neorhodopirellula pilleata]TWT96467.1 hypothetical protein Pla100_29470 [Neorhodopirellula pilleata]